MRMSDFKAMQAKVSGKSQTKPQPRPKPKMNKTESLYALTLEAMKRAGEIYDYQYEAVRLKLADNTTYTPDFMIIKKFESPHSNGFILVTEFHETKGFLRDDAAVKFKVARRLFPQFIFKMLRLKQGIWMEMLR